MTEKQTMAKSTKMPLIKLLGGRLFTQTEKSKERQKSKFWILRLIKLRLRARIVYSGTPGRDPGAQMASTESASIRFNLFWYINKPMVINRKKNLLITYGQWDASFVRSKIILSVEFVPNFQIIIPGGLFFRAWENRGRNSSLCHCAEKGTEPAPSN